MFSGEHGFGSSGTCTKGCAARCSTVHVSAHTSAPSLVQGTRNESARASFVGKHHQQTSSSVFISNSTHSNVLIRICSHLIKSNPTLSESLFCIILCCNDTCFIVKKVSLSLSLLPLFATFKILVVKKPLVGCGKGMGII